MQNVLLLSNYEWKKFKLQVSKIAEVLIQAVIPQQTSEAEED